MANVPTLLTSADLSASQTSGAPASVSSTTIIQANTFAIGNWLYLNGSTYALAKADSANTASVVGIVSAASSTQFTLTTSGLVAGLSGLTVGANYFLSPTTSGAITTTEPTTTGYVSAPVGIATSATSIQVAIDRGTIVRNTVTTFTVGGDVNIWYPVVFNRNANTDFKFRITSNERQSTYGFGFCNFCLYGDLYPYGGTVTFNSGYDIEQSMFYSGANDIDDSDSMHGCVGGYSTDPYSARITVWLRGGRDYYLDSYFGDITLQTIIYSTSITSFNNAGNPAYTVSSFKIKTFNDYDFNLVYLHNENIVGSDVNGNLAGQYSYKNYSKLAPVNFNSIETGYISARGNINTNSALTANSITTNNNITAGGNIKTNSVTIYANNGIYTTSGVAANGTITAGGNITAGSLYVRGTISCDNTVTATGYKARSGLSGVYSNWFNIYWTGSAARLWIDNTDLGNISVTSDYRIKKNIETQDSSAIDRIAKIRPVKYEFADYKELFKEDGVQREGFIAHELQEVIPSAVDGEKDAEDQIQSLKLDALCSVMVKAIQEQQAMIDALKAEVELLKNK